MCEMLNFITAVTESTRANIFRTEEFAKDLRGYLDLPELIGETLLLAYWSHVLIAQCAYRSRRETDALLLASGLRITRHTAVHGATPANFEHRFVRSIVNRILDDLVEPWRRLNITEQEIGLLLAAILFSPGVLEKPAEERRQVLRWYEAYREELCKIMEDEPARYAEFSRTSVALRSITASAMELLAKSGVNLDLPWEGNV